MATATAIRSAALYYKAGTSDKVYYVWVENEGRIHTVKFKYGRRGTMLTGGTKLSSTNALDALLAFDKIVAEKVVKGYKFMPHVEVSDTSQKVTATWTLGDTTSCQLLNPVDRSVVETYLTHDEWLFQEKHDGRRMLLGFNDGTAEAWNREGQLMPPPEEYCSVLQNCFEGFSFVIDGEACGDTYWAFDILWLEGLDCRALPLHERLTNLGMLLRSAKPQEVIRQVMSAETTMQKKSLLRAVESAGREGLAIKNKNCIYTAGRPNSMGPALKFKFVESASCKVIKINAKRSVELGLYEQGVKLTDRDLSDSAREEKSKHLTSVGNVTIPANHHIPEVGEVVEVQYLYAYPGGSLYQPVYRGPRDDVEVDLISSLKFKPSEH